MTPHFKNIRDALEALSGFVQSYINDHLGETTEGKLAQFWVDQTHDELTALSQLQKEREELVELVKCMIENDPDDLIADGGYVMLDHWRFDAKALLEKLRGM